MDCSVSSKAWIIFSLQTQFSNPMATGMTKNQRQCQNGGKSWDDLSTESFLPNNISNDTSTEKADKWYLNSSAKLHLHYWAEISLFSQTSLLSPLSTVAQWRIKPTIFLFQVFGTVVLCAKPLCPKITQVDSGRTLYRVSHTTPQKKSICLAGPLLFENLTTFFLFDSNEPIQNLCILSGLKWWSGRKHKSGESYY